MAEVRLENIGKTYPDGKKAIEDLSFVINDGEFVVLVGPSGCGKSTTLRMIAGLEAISTGTLYIDGERVNDLSPGERKLAMVFQNYALYPHMTTRQNMSFGLKISKLPKKEIAQRVQAAAEVLHIEDLLDKKPGKMSGGQRQRVAIGRAIVRRPKLFLFDEPLSNLDAELRTKMRIEIARLHHTLGATMIYVTHDQVEAMTLGDRIVVLKDGLIQQIDTPINLYNDPGNQFVASFIGTPAMNFIKGKLQTHPDGWQLVHAQSSILLPRSCFAFRATHHDQEIVMGIRPEAIYPSDQGVSSPHTIRVQIEGLEILGSEQLVYARYHQLPLVARFSMNENYAPLGPADFCLNLSDAYFFDAATGTRIRD